MVQGTSDEKNLGFVMLEAVVIAVLQSGFGSSTELNRAKQLAAAAQMQNVFHIAASKQMPAHAHAKRLWQSHIGLALTAL